MFIGLNGLKVFLFVRVEFLHYGGKHTKVDDKVIITSFGFRPPRKSFSLFQ